MPAKRKSAAPKSGRRPRTEPIASDPAGPDVSSKPDRPGNNDRSSNSDRSSTPAEPPSNAGPVADAEPTQPEPMNRAERRARARGRAVPPPTSRGKVAGPHGPVQTRRNWANRRTG